jgi:hypothetical protein
VIVSVRGAACAVSCRYLQGKAEPRHRAFSRLSGLRHWHADRRRTGNLKAACAAHQKGQRMTPARTAHCAKHQRHVGICPACQRARIAAEKQQLAEAGGLAYSMPRDSTVPDRTPIRSTSTT